jgi:RNA polymerase sigma-70 factor, ECF subfamily
MESALERNHPIETTDETALVEKARADPQAFTALYRKYALPIYRYLYSRVGSLSDAEDLTSQVFLEALENLARYRPTHSFPAWLFTIARRRAIDYYRRRRPLQSLSDEISDPAADPLARLAQSEDLRQLAGLVTALDDDDRELIRLRFAGNLSYPAIGEVLGRSPDAVRMALQRLLNRLEKQMENSNE